VKYVNGTRLDDRIIRTDWDVGFRDGRQYGRGKSGGQVRDEYRVDYDPGRGGYGKQVETTDGSVATTDDTSSTTWRDKLQGTGGESRKRDRDEGLSGSNKRQKDSEQDKNPRFREDKDSDDDEE